MPQDKTAQQKKDTGCMRHLTHLLTEDWGLYVPGTAPGVFVGSIL